MKQEFKIQVPDGCSAKIEQQDGFLVVVFEPKKEEKWVPKDGDVIAFGADPEDLSIAIFESMEEDDCFKAHAVFDNRILFYKPGWLFMNIRPATDDEKQRLFDALAKEGKRWNAETKQIEDLPRWRAKDGEKYYFISDCLDVDFTSEDSDEYDDSYYAADNYFKTEEAASRAAEKIRKILKESEAE